MTLMMAAVISGSLMSFLLPMADLLFVRWNSLHETQGIAKPLISLLEATDILILLMSTAVWALGYEHGLPVPTPA